MRFALILFVVLFLGMALAIGLREDNGYVLMAWGDTSVEMSMAMLILVMGSLFIALWLSFRLLIGIWRLPARLKEMRRRMRLHKARASLTRGLIEMAEGRWKESERSLTRYARYSDTPLPHYLMAARAAQAQHAADRRDTHLRLAYETTPAATIAVLITQAELQLADGQFERALATLSRLRELSPTHAFALRLLATLHETRGEWETLHGLIPDLRRHDALEGEELDALVARVHARLLRSAADCKDTAQAETLWSELPRGLRHRPELVNPYTECLRLAERDNDAESLLRGVLRQHWDDDLVLQYGLLRASEPGRQLGRAEAWLREHGDTPVLLLTCGRLCMRNSLWGKARSYLESSIALAQRADTWHELAKLMQHTGESERAAEYTRRGLLTVLGKDTGIEGLPVARPQVQPRSGERARSSGGE